MPELLKNAYNKRYIKQLADRIQHHCSHFDVNEFVKSVLDTQWPQRELKDRMYHITRCIHQQLACSYADAIAVLSNCVQYFGSYEAMLFPAYIELYGLENSAHWNISKNALAQFTQYSSSEFAVRPFIIKAPKKMMAQMQRWANHDNYHVRRLASEGCRPRLPWALSLVDFKTDPSLILPIMETLKQDPKEYVRRSVANNLNDISKDHPIVVREIAKRWLGQHPDTDWIVKHACRTLLKRGDKKILALFGYRQLKHVTVNKFSCDKILNEGEHFHFSFSLNSKTKQLGKLRIEYAIGYVKANRSLSQKIFKISEGNITQKNKKINKSHSFKIMTTRKHYPGKHTISIIINGETKMTRSFILE